MVKVHLCYKNSLINTLSPVSCAKFINSIYKFLRIILGIILKNMT